MSFILDALRKSENDRQRQASPNVSVATVDAERRWQPGWIALVVTGVGAALLAVTVVWWLLTPVAPTPSTGVRAAQERRLEDPTATTAEVRSLAQEARREKPAAEAEPEPVATLRETAATPTAASPAPSRGDVPLTVTEAMAGGLSLPHLNLDIHVFAPQADERFVFINSRKYREQETLREGPVVREITSDGVILEIEGQRLLLPRD